jgi:hypothetical protein
MQWADCHRDPVLVLAGDKQLTVKSCHITECYTVLHNKLV